MEEETNYWQCPNCECFFSLEEFDEQHCGFCGWPENEENEEDEDIDIGNLGYPYDGTDDGER